MALKTLKMEKVEVAGKVALFLDHRQLIKELYAEKYALKPELFAFHAKNVRPEQQSAPPQQTRKRRAKSAQDAAQPTKELQELAALTHSCTKVLQERLLFPPVDRQSEQLARSWEESHDFPAFHGANPLAEFQTYALAQREYLIPPRCRFYNGDVTEQLPRLDERYDLIVIDPPWRNKYIRRLKRARTELGYSMLDTAELRRLPIARLLQPRALVAIWCTNSPKQQRALCDELLPAWGLRLLHKLPWVKLNTNGEPIGPFSGPGHKQPFELLYIAVPQHASEDFGQLIGAVDALLSVPSVVHSHKPPLLTWLKSFTDVQPPNCLEIFARYLQPEFTCVGLEVLKLMDRRLYEADEADVKLPCEDQL